MATITDRKPAEIYKRFFDARSHHIEIRLYHHTADGRVPYDASSLTSIHFRLMQDTSDAALLLNDAMTVSTTDLEDGVKNLVTLDTSALTVTAPGDALWYLQVVSGGKNFIWEDTFWECKTFADGPTS